MPESSVIIQPSQEPRGHYFLGLEQLSSRPNLLIASGCSWTAGDGTLLDIKNAVSYPEYSIARFKKSYPAILGNLLDADVINLGKSASSNDYIYESLIKQVPRINEIKHNYNRIIVFTGFTEYSRFQAMPEHIKWLRDIQPGWDQSPELLYYIKHRLLTIGHLDAYHKNLLNTMYSIQNLCNVNGFEYYSAHMIGHELRVDFMEEEKRQLLDYYISQLNMDNYMHTRFFKFASFNEYLQIEGSKKGNDDYFFQPCLHPNEEGYEIIANVIYDFIKDVYE